MIKLFEGLDSKTREIVSEIATADLKVNRVGFNKKTHVTYVKQIIQDSEILLRGECANQ